MSIEQRLELQVELELIMATDPRVMNPGNHVSYQPNEQSQLEYPHLTYSRNPAYTTKADNITYLSKDRYTATLIDRKPDNPIFDILVGRKFTSHNASFAVDGLNHDVFDLYN